MLSRRLKFGIALAVTSIILLATLAPAQATITFGRWRDINPTQYVSGLVSSTIRGIYIRDGGSGSIGAGDGWAVGGDSAAPFVSHYDGFSWQILASPVPGPNTIYEAVNFCTAPGAPGVGLCSSDRPVNDGWLVGGNEGPPDAAVAAYWDGSGLTSVTNGLAGVAGELFSVFMACRSTGSTGCPSGADFNNGATYAVGSTPTRTHGVIMRFNGNPKLGGGWTLDFTSAMTTRFRGVYLYADPGGFIGGFAVGDGGVIARRFGGSWTEAVVAPGVTFRSVFVDQSNPLDAWAVGDFNAGTQIWHFGAGTWSGPVSPAACATPCNLLSVFLTSTSEGWAVGTGSTILHSTNLGSGDVWLPLTSTLQTATGSGIDLLSTSFANSGNGWAVGTNGVILQTSNSNCGVTPSPCWGGSTSITQSPNLRTVFELSSSDTWAAGDFDTASTTNSIIHWDGIKWHRVTVSPPPSLVGGPYNIFGIYMLGSSEGWAVGGDKTGPDMIPVAMKWNGNSWIGSAATMSACTCGLRSVFMISSSEGWAVGTKGNIMHFTPGAWGSYASPVIGTFDLNSVFISNSGNNPNAGWAVGNHGTVLVLSISGGVATWNLIHPLGFGTVNLQNLYGVYFTDSNHGWIVGDLGTILTTSDGGTSWSGGAGQVVGGPASTVLRSVFVDQFGTGSGNGDGWAVGDNGIGPNALFAHWDGASWTNTAISPSLAAGLAVYSVSLKGPEDGFAVGVGISGAPAPLAGIFHLDPTNPPVSGGNPTTTATSVVTTTTSVVASTSAGTTSSATSTTSSESSMTTSTPVSSTTTSASIVTSTVTVAPTTTATSGTSAATSESSSVSTPLALPPIPGFPWESIIAGIIIGMTALAILRRRRK